MDLFVNLKRNHEPDCGYKVFADNFFTGGKTDGKREQEKRYNSTCTVRSNRMRGWQLKNKKTIKEDGRGPYDYKTQKDHSIAAVIWYDNRAVTLFFTEIGHEPEGVAKRWSKVARNHAEAPMPAVVGHYNKHMGGVNLLDYLLARHRYLMKSRRWYNYLSWMLYISSWTIKRTVPHLSV